MTEQTANKLVLFFLFGGIAFALVRKGNSDARTTYKRIWGTTLLALGGSALAGFVPQIVGPYFLLIIIAYATGNIKALGGAATTLKKQAGAKS